MFNNIGRKIKTLASIMTWIGIIASVIGGAILMSGSFNPLPGLLVMVVGSLSAWISSFLLYAFGQLVDNSDILVNLRGGYVPNGQPAYNQQYAPKPEPVHSKEAVSISTLEKWKKEGVISEEEYNQMINSVGKDSENDF